MSHLLVFCFDHFIYLIKLSIYISHYDLALMFKNPFIFMNSAFCLSNLINLLLEISNTFIIILLYLRLGFVTRCQYDFCVQYFHIDNLHTLTYVHIHNKDLWNLDVLDIFGVDHFHSMPDRDSMLYYNFIFSLLIH